MRHYTIILRPEVDEGGYSVSVPMLPGCHTQGTRSRRRWPTRGRRSPRGLDPPRRTARRFPTSRSLC